MTTQLQKISEQLTGLIYEFKLMGRDVKFALDWITSHDEKERKATEAAATETHDNRKWFWRTIGGTVIVAAMTSILNGIGGIIVIVVSLMLNDKITAMVQTFAYLIKLSRP